MLVLSRKEGERIMIGRSIVVTILETRGGRVRIGIDAPQDVPVLREEICNRQRPTPRAAAWISPAIESAYHPEFA